MELPGEARARQRKYPFIFGQDIPIEKAKVVARLDIMKLNGWRALESMTIPELDALQAEAESAIVDVDEYGFAGLSNAHDRTIAEARKAINNQRHKIRQEEIDRQFEQIRRYNAIMAAAGHIKAAVDQVETAYGIERDPSYWASFAPSQFREIDPPTMTDDELRSALNECDWAMRCNPLPDFSLFAMLKTPASSAIAAELKEQNGAYRARIETARANRTAAREELERRKAKAEASAIRTEELSASLDEVVADLQSRLEELEARK